MKNRIFLSLAASPILLIESVSAALIVGPGTPYGDLFAPDAVQESNVTPNFLGISLGTNDDGDYGNWNLSANGGVSVGLLGLEIARSVTQTSLKSGSLIFGQDTSLLGSGALGDIVGANALYEWEATLHLNEALNTINVAANTMYTISMDVTSPSGLLSDTLGLFSSVRVDFLDGNTSLTSGSSNSIISLLGIIGTGPTQTLTFQIATGGTVDGNAVGLRFSGSELASASLLGIGDEFIALSDLAIDATPIPEPSASMLSAACLGLLALRRHRRS